MSTRRQFSPTASPLLTGPAETVLVDAYMQSDVAEIARRIVASGRPLTTLYLTSPPPATATSASDGCWTGSHGRATLRAMVHGQSAVLILVTRAWASYMT